MRLENWERRLGDYLDTRRGQDFAYGTNDCGMFAAGAVEAVTGVDPIPSFRGAYDSATTSIRALKRLGKGTLDATIDSLFDEHPIGYARRGDIVWNGESVGVCIGHEALFVGEIEGVSGLVSVPRSGWVKAWTVG